MSARVETAGGLSPSGTTQTHHSYHLACTLSPPGQLPLAVNVNGVFPSYRCEPVSARVFQLHRGQVGDSGGVVTPFMQDSNHEPRHFATLGRSRLPPSFSGDSLPSLSQVGYPSTTGQASARIPRLIDLAQTCGFDNQSLPPLYWVPTHTTYTACTRTALLANVRAQFAEFLQPDSPFGLGVPPPTHQSRSKNGSSVRCLSWSTFRSVEHRQTLRTLPFHHTPMPSASPFEYTLGSV